MECALEMVTVSFSRGCRNISRVFFENFPSSSRNNTPRWARDTSPGLGFDPPPMMDTADAE